ncbi:MAG TPA: hypothetical protein IAD07_02635 [Candidatus Fimivicinus intestinavium]|nr:hypothetical protein [Candidatus Fimivicinus intestinavium]
MNKNSLKKVSALLKKKTTSYLKVSFVVFVISLMIVASVSVVGISQYVNLQHEFIKNDNTHIICVGGIEVGNRYDSLTVKDREAISKILQANYPDMAFELILQSRIPNGISDKEGNHFSFYVVGNDCAKWLKLDRMEDDTVYSADPDESLPAEICLELPVIESQGGGMLADRYVDYKVLFNNGADPKNIFETYSNTPGRHYYINYNTYINLTSVMYQIPKSQVAAQDTVEQIFIYVAEIQDVEKAAVLLNGKGYATDYTLKAFESLDRTVQSLIKIGAAVILAIFVFTCVNLILSFDSYLKLQKKDIAILKHLGYRNADIRKIYRKNISGIFFKLGIGVTAYTAAIGMLLVEMNRWVYVLGLMLALDGALLLVLAIISGCVVNRYVNKGMLELMKVDKAFE